MFASGEIEYGVIQKKTSYPLADFLYIKKNKKKPIFGGKSNSPAINTLNSHRLSFVGSNQATRLLIRPTCTDNYLLVL